MVEPVTRAGRHSNLVTVLAYGQVAANCGPPRPIIVRLELAPGLQASWPGLTHAVTGLYLGGTGDQLPP